MVHLVEFRFLFLNSHHRMGAHAQDTSRVATATGIHRHLDDLLFDLRRLPSLAIVQQKRASLSLSALAAPVALLALTGVAVSDDIGALAMGTMQDLDDHDVTRWC
jgi:hypothetical protein